MDDEESVKEAADAMAAVEAERKRLEALRPHTADPISAAGNMTNFMSFLASEEGRIQDQIARAQHQIRDILVERENEQVRLKKLIAKQREYLSKEKAIAQTHNLQLPCAFSRLAVTPKQLKSKGKTVPAPFPDNPEVWDQCKKVIAGALGRFGVKPVDVSISPLHDCIIFFDIVITSLLNVSSVNGVTETLDRAFRDTTDYTGVRLATQDFIDMDKLNLFSVWPFTRIEAEIETRFGIDLPTKLLENIAGPVNESAASLRKKWELRVKTAESAPEQADVKELESLLDTASNMPPKPKDKEQCFFTTRQGAASVDELMADAAIAHRQLKAWLAPGTAWAEADFDTSVSGTGADRALDLGDGGGGVAFPGGRVWDMGLQDEAQIRESIAVIERHDDVAPFRDVTDVSRILVTFTSAKEMLAAVECVNRGRDVAWMDNGVTNPSCLGYRDICFCVRQQVPVSASMPRMDSLAERVHFSELRFTFVEFEEFRRTEGVTHINQMVRMLQDSETIPKEELVGPVLHSILQVMDHTYCRAFRHSKRVYALMDCDADACSYEV
jgi:hypothetical protein